MCAILSKLHNQQPFSFDQMEKVEGNEGQDGDGDGDGDGKRRRTEYPSGVRIHSLGMSSNYVIDRYAKHLNDRNIQYFKRWVGMDDLIIE